MNSFIDFNTEESANRLHNMELVLRRKGASKMNINGYKYLFNIRNLLIHFEFDMSEFAIYLGNINKKWTQIGGTEAICFIGIPVVYAFLNRIKPECYVKEKSHIIERFSLLEEQMEFVSANWECVISLFNDNVYNEIYLYEDEINNIIKNSIHDRKEKM
jgi:hypothetical protein